MPFEPRFSNLFVFFSKSHPCPSAIPLYTLFRLLPDYQTSREWLSGCVNEVDEMKRISGILTAFELALVVTIDEQTHGTMQGVGATRETSRGSGQTSQVVTHLRIICFDRVRVRFSIGDGISAPVIPEQVIDIEGVTEIPFCLGSLVNDGLDRFPGAIPE